MHFDPEETVAFKPSGVDTTPVHKVSRRLRGLEPEFGCLTTRKRAVMTSTASQTTQCSGSTSPVVFHTPRTPRPFHGEPYEDVEDWLDDFNRVAEFNDWDDSRKLRHVYFSLEESARIWFVNNERKMTSWPEFRRRLLKTYGSEERKEKAEQALQSRAQKPNESVAMFVEDMSFLFRRADPEMSEAVKVRHLMRGVKEQLFAGLARSPPTTVAEFVREASTMERSLRQRATQYGRQVNIAACGSPFDDMRALRELVRSVLREELQLLQGGGNQPTVATIADVIREEVRRAVEPPTSEVERSVPTYTDVLRTAAPVTRPVSAYTDVVRTPAPVAPVFRPAAPQPFQRVLNPATRYEPRRLERKAALWRTSDNRPLCYHCGEDGHVIRHCPYRRMGLRGFSPDAPRPRYGERPREIQEYLAVNELPSTPRVVHQSRSPSPRRYSSPGRPLSSDQTRNRSPSPRRGN